jgi:hypothetical protein
VTWLAGGVATLLVAGFGLSALGRTPAGDPAGTGPSTAQTQDGWPAETRDGSVISVAATDAEHLYAGVNTCTVDGAGARLCTARLIGSDDGGATWTVRQAAFGDGQISAPAPGVLLQNIETINDDYDGEAANGPKAFHTRKVSTDGGRTWREIHQDTAPVSQVAADGWIESICTSMESCAIIAYNPATARSAPLSGVPAMDLVGPPALPSSAGVWITGHELGTGRPLVTVSHDRGRTWTTHVFGPGEADFPDTSQMFGFALPASVDGTTAYSLVQVPKPIGTVGAGPTPSRGGVTTLVYRTTDGGHTWQRADPGHTVPSDLEYFDGDSYVAADGTHVVFAHGDPPQKWYTSGNGSAYRLVKPDGLSDRLTRSGLRPAVLVVAPGVYLAFDSNAVYRSADGLHWTRTQVKAPS